MSTTNESNESVIKNKIPDEIIARIESIRKDINRLVDEMEYPGVHYDKNLTEIINYYSEELEEDRTFLEKAKNRLKTAGYENLMPESEVKADKLSNAILSGLREFSFSTYGYFGGEDRQVITFNEKKEGVYARYSMLEQSYWQIRDEAYYGSLTTMLTNLHLDEWKQRYENNDITDGEQWEIKIRCDGLDDELVFSGSNEYPYNFNDLRNFFDGNNTDADDTGPESSFWNISSISMKNRFLLDQYYGCMDISEDGKVRQYIQQCGARKKEHIRNIKVPKAKIDSLLSDAESLLRRWPSSADMIDDNEWHFTITFKSGAKLELEDNVVSDDDGSSLGGLMEKFEEECSGGKE